MYVLSQEYIIPKCIGTLKKLDSWREKQDIHLWKRRCMSSTLTRHQRIHVKAMLCVPWKPGKTQSELALTWYWKKPSTRGKYKETLFFNTASSVVQESRDWTWHLWEEGPTWDHHPEPQQSIPWQSRSFLHSSVAVWVTLRVRESLQDLAFILEKNSAA